MARQLRTDLIISVKDMASGPLGAIKNNLRNFKALNNLSFDKQFDHSARSIKRSSKHAGQFGIGLGFVATQGMKAAYEMEKMLNKLQAVNRLTAEQRVQFKGYAKELNNEFPFTNSEITGAAWELAKAGFDHKTVRATLPDALRLAMAGDIDRGEAADIATNVLTGMRMPIETTKQAAESVRLVIDTLSYAANKSNTDISKMGQTFKYIAPIAAAAGMSIEQVAAMTMVMANNGIKSSEAGTALRSSVIRLVAPSNEAAATMADLGISFSDFAQMGKLMDGDDIIQGLKSRGIYIKRLKSTIDEIMRDTALQQKPGQLVANLTEAIVKDKGITNIEDQVKLRDKIGKVVANNVESIDFLKVLKILRDKKATIAQMSKIFNMRQANRILTLLTDDLDKKTNEVEKNAKGTAQYMANINMGGIVGQVARLNAAWTNLWVTLGESGVLGHVGAVLEGIKESLELIAKLSPTALQFLSYSLAALTVLGPVGLLLGGLGSSFTMLGSTGRAAVSVLGKFGSKLGSGLLSSSKLANKSMFSLGKTFLGTVPKFALTTTALLAMFNPLTSLNQVVISLLWGTASIGVAGAASTKKLDKFVLTLASMFMAMKNPWTAIKTGTAIASMGFIKMFNPINAIKSVAGSAMWAVRGLVSGAAALAIISWPVVLGVSAIAGVIGYWDELKAFFTGFFAEFDDAFADAGLGRPLQLLADIAKSIGSALGSALGYIKELFGFGGDDNHLTSWMDAGRLAARALAKGIAALLSPLKSAYNGLKNLFSFGGGKSNSPGKIEGRYKGGSIRAGRPYMVGERGPELIMPSRNGFVVPNNKLSRSGGSSVGNVTVTINTNHSMNNAASFGKEVGKQVRSAVMDSHSDGAYS